MDSLTNRETRYPRSGQAGVTLIELLVVVAVLAILAAIVTLNVVFVANSAKAAAACTDEKTIQTAVAAYRSDTGAFPISTANIGGARGDSTTTSSVPPNNFVDVDELVNPPAPNHEYIHTQPNYADDGAFTYSNTAGSVVAASAASSC